MQDHEVIIHTDAYTDPARVIERVAGCDALLLTQQRVPLTRQMIERLPRLGFISQTGRNTNHLDISACTQHGIVVSAGSVVPPESNALELFAPRILTNCPANRNGA